MANDISNINSSKPGQASDNEHTTSSQNTEEKLKTLEQQLGQESVVNEQKVAHVRAALQSGSYQVDPEKIAEKMLDLESNIDD